MSFYGLRKCMSYMWSDSCIYSTGPDCDVAGCNPVPVTVHRSEGIYFHGLPSRRDVLGGMVNALPAVVTRGTVGDVSGAGDVLVVCVSVAFCGRGVRVARWVLPPPDPDSLPRS